MGGTLALDVGHHHAQDRALTLDVGHHHAQDRALTLDDFAQSFELPGMGIPTGFPAEALGFAGED